MTRTRYILAVLLAVLHASFAENPAKETTVENGCTIERYGIFSASMKKEVKIVVVLPPAYAQEPAQRFPILHALHGKGAPYAIWSEMSPLRKALVEHPMIVTCFDGDESSWYLDAPEKPDSQFTTFFFEEFIPFLDTHYRVDPTRRGLTGFSMGGFGAFHYTLTKPSMFASVSSLSGAFRPMDGNDPKVKKWFTPLLGPFSENKKRYETIDLYERLRQTVKVGTPLPPVYLHCGTEDFLLEANRMMRDALKEQNLSCEYLENEGDHNWAFWKSASAAIIDFHARNGLSP